MIIFVFCFLTDGIILLRFVVHVSDSSCEIRNVCSAFYDK